METEDGPAPAAQRPERRSVVSAGDGDIASGPATSDSGPPTHAALHRLERPRSSSTPVTGAASSGKLKSKAKAAWNNFANGWVIPGPSQLSTFDSDAKLWLLGQFYYSESGQKRRSFSSVMERSARGKNTDHHLAEFYLDFRSRFWMTYRRKFWNIGASTYSSDTGWGCMIRSGQMILAQALVVHLLGRGWRLGRRDKQAEKMERKVASLFGDRLCDDCPFSIHNMLALGEQRGQTPGQWFGPAQVSYLMRDALDEACGRIPELDNIRIYVAQDSMVYKGDVYHIMERHSAKGGDGDVADAGSTGTQCSVIVLVPVRLGRSRLNPIYAPCIRSLFSLECCLGVIGGRPKHSLYFIGSEDSELIYLDPHYCQDTVDSRQESFSTASYHCPEPRKMPIKHMDPSCTIGFLFNSRTEFEYWSPRILEMVIPPMQPDRYPIFSFSEQCCADVLPVSPRCSSEPSPVGRFDLDDAEEGDHDSEDIEDFVLMES